MFLSLLLLACQNDRYLNHPVSVEAEPSTEPEPVEITCTGSKIDVTPDSVSFVSILTPFEEDIDLQTDTKSVKIINNCDGPLDIYAWAEGGEVGTFVLNREEDDRDGAGSGEIVFTIQPSESIRNISYTASARADVADYDEGQLELYVIEGGALGFHAPVKLEATVVNVLMAK